MLESEPRVSRQVERGFAEAEHDRRQREAAEDKRRQQVEKAEHDAEIHQAALHAIRAVERVRELLRGDRRETARSLVHHSQRMRKYLNDLR